MNRFLLFFLPYAFVCASLAERVDAFGVSVAVLPPRLVACRPFGASVAVLPPRLVYSSRRSLHVWCVGRFAPVTFGAALASQASRLVHHSLRL